MSIEVSGLGKVTNIRGVLRDEFENTISSIVFSFDTLNLVFIVMDDDSVEMIECCETDLQSKVAEVLDDNVSFYSLSEKKVWKDILGRNILWMWMLVNNQGYKDGVQFEFIDGTIDAVAQPIIIQFVGVASIFRVYRLSLLGSSVLEI